MNTQKILHAMIMAAAAAVTADALATDINLQLVTNHWSVSSHMQTVAQDGYVDQFYKKSYIRGGEDKANFVHKYFKDVSGTNTDHYTYLYDWGPDLGTTNTTLIYKCIKNGDVDDGPTTNSAVILSTPMIPRLEYCNMHLVSGDCGQVLADWDRNAVGHAHILYYGDADTVYTISFHVKVYDVTPLTLIDTEDSNPTTPTLTLLGDNLMGGAAPFGLGLGARWGYRIRGNLGSGSESWLQNVRPPAGPWLDDNDADYTVTVVGNPNGGQICVTPIWTAPIWQDNPFLGGNVYPDGSFGGFNNYDNHWIFYEITDVECSDSHQNASGRNPQAGRTTIEEYEFFRNQFQDANGAPTGSTNLNGGNLYLSSGIATGNGESGVIISSAIPGSSGTSDTANWMQTTFNHEGVQSVAPDLANLSLLDYVGNLTVNDAHQGIALRHTTDGSKNPTDYLSVCRDVSGTTTWYDRLTLSSTRTAVSGELLAATGLMIGTGGNPGNFSGSRMELNYAGGVGYITAYDRDNSLWKELILRGQDIQLSPNGSEEVKVDSGGLKVTGGVVRSARVKTGLTNNSYGAGNGFVEIPIASGAATGGVVQYTIWAKDTNGQMQSISGRLVFTLLNHSGTIGCDAENLDQQKVCTSGTFSAEVDVSAGTGKITLVAYPQSSLTPTELGIRYLITLDSDTTVTHL